MIYPPGDYRAPGQVAAHVATWQHYCLVNFVREEQAKHKAHAKRA